MAISRIERTEEGARHGLDSTSKYKGIAKHPRARAWILKKIERAIESGDKATIERAQLRAKRYGLL